MIRKNYYRVKAHFDSNISNELMFYLFILTLLILLISFNCAMARGLIAHMHLMHKWIMIAVIQIFLKDFSHDIIVC